MKTTAVLTDTLRNFHNWCKKRRIKEIKKDVYIDFEGESYIPVIKLNDVFGRYFNDYEEIKGIYAINHHELIIAIKHRII